jgi:hypothetical protein
VDKDVQFFRIKGRLATFSVNGKIITSVFGIQCKTFITLNGFGIKAAITGIPTRVIYH